MSTNFRIPTASLGAGGTWREEEQPHSHTSFPRRPSTSLLAFPSGWSTTALNDEHLKGGPGVQLLEQGVWGVVAEKEQRLGGVQKTRITRSTYSRRRRSLSGPGTVKQGNKGKRLRSNRLVKDLERHDSQTTVEEVVEEHKRPNQPEHIDVEDDDDSSTIICAIDTRLVGSDTVGHNSHKLGKGKKAPTDIDPSNSPSTTTTPPSPISDLVEFSSPQPSKKMSSRSSRSSRHSSSSQSPSPSHTCSPPTSKKSSLPSSPRPKSSSTSPQTTSRTRTAEKDRRTTVPLNDKDDKNDKDKDDKDDWHQIHEPEQRRRIQNRIAQRKFREKARSLKDQAARDEQNRRFAGCAYTCPSVDGLLFENETYFPEEMDGFAEGVGEGEVTPGEETRDKVGGERVLSGLPWGGLSMRFVVGRGHEYYRYQTTSRGSGSGSGSGNGTGMGTGTAATTLSPTSTITALNTPQLQQQQQQSATYYGHATSAGSGSSSSLSPYGMMMMPGSMGIGMGLMGSGDMDMDIDVDYSMASGPTEGRDTGMEYVTSPSGSMAGVTSGTGTGTGTGMDVTYYDSSPYYYGYGTGGGGGGGSVYGGYGGRAGRM
ncbi:hypothetical protein SMACR_02531 [Sordaria macrospora]|nr:hypothetical protein SMACR_02531 [Sordaria macrospora]WPJ60641.1 hypothetical protein SMAC4_02531 [Sordaria macrospora]